MRALTRTAIPAAVTDEMDVDWPDFEDKPPEERLALLLRIAAEVEHALLV
jgi:hypothetical protein